MIRHALPMPLDPLKVGVAPDYGRGRWIDTAARGVRGTGVQDGRVRAGRVVIDGRGAL